MPLSNYKLHTVSVLWQSGKYLIYLNSVAHSRSTVQQSRNHTRYKKALDSHLVMTYTTYIIQNKNVLLRIQQV